MKQPQKARDEGRVKVSNVKERADPRASIPGDVTVVDDND